MAAGTNNQTALSLLLGREKRSADLLRRPKPDCMHARLGIVQETRKLRLTKHCRVEAIGPRNQDRWCQNDQQEMSCQEVGTPQRHFDDFDDKLSSRLRYSGVAETPTVPFPCPPGAIGFVMLIFPCEEDCDQDLLDGPLNGDDGDYAKYGMGGIPKFQEPL